MKASTKGVEDERDLTADRWRRIGMIVPSSNTVAEPETARLLEPLGDAVSVHVCRLSVQRISLSPDSLGQFADERTLAAARTLAEVRPDAILWNGTAASWLGLDADERLVAAIRADLGVPATSASLTYRALYRAMGVGRVGLVTPYVDEIQERIRAVYAAEGLEVVAERHLGDGGNFSFAEYSPSLVAGLVREVAAARPDAVAIVCTNFRGGPPAPALEAELGLPVLDSVAVALWGALRLAGVDPAPLAERHGRLFAVSAPAGTD